MQRRLPLDAPGTLHHIMVRGIEERQIFETDRDREDIMDQLRDVSIWFGVRVKGTGWGDKRYYGKKNIMETGLPRTKDNKNIDEIK